MLVDEKVDTVGVEPPEEAPPRRPFWPVAVFLFGLLVALIGAAFLLDQRFRPWIGVFPVQVAEAPTATAVVPTAAPPTAVPTAPASPTAQPTQAATPSPQSTRLPTQAPSNPAAPAVASAGTPTLPSNLADLLSPLQKELVDAYLRYWDIRIKAYYDLDTSRLSEVMDGPELARERTQIEGLRAQGRAVALDVEHNIRLSRATADDATVYDEYVNRSLFVDPTTRKETPSDQPPIVERVSFEFRRIDGKWKVVDGARNG